MLVGRGVTPYQTKGGATAFSIANSFLLDGLNKYFVIPSIDLASYLQGSVDFTLLFCYKRSSTGSLQALCGSAGGKFIVWHSLANTIEVYFNNGTQTAVKGTAVLNSTTGFYTLAVTYKNSNPIGSRGGIYVDSVLGVASDNVQDNTSLSTGTFKIGTRSGGVNFFNGYLAQPFSLINRALTQSEINNWHNGGKPKNPQTLFGADCKAFYNPDTSGGTAQFVMTDSINSTSATSVNLVNTDKTTITPY